MGQEVSAEGGPIVGIDLGTTNSVVSVFRRGKTEVLANDAGNRTTPSVVGFLDGLRYEGEAAKDLPASSQLYDAKRLLGRPWGDENVQADRQTWPFVLEERCNSPMIKVAIDGVDEVFSPEEISAYVLRNLKATAEAGLGVPVSRAVVTVPAYFNERQRQATRCAGFLADLQVVALINEPTAAALAYGLDKNTAAKKTVFVYDLGGGTFDVSIMTIHGNEFRVLASGGDTHLGGQDFDTRLIGHCVKEIREKHGVDLYALMDLQALHDLRRACELAKRKLSNHVETPLPLYFARHRLGYSTSINRALFEDLCADLFQKTIDVSRKVLAEANVEPSKIDEVVLVGGSSRIPKIRAMLSELFGGKELSRAVNADEAVACGAAIHAAALLGDKSAGPLVKLVDVTPLSLGVEIIGDRFSVVIEKNTPVPCKRTRRYYTVRDNQTTITSDVYQGERALVRYNHCLNKRYSVEVPALPARQAYIDVTFEIDKDGLLTVTAVQPTTKKEVRVQITQKDAHVTERDAQEMIERANKYQSRDASEVGGIMAALKKQELA